MSMVITRFEGTIIALAVEGKHALVKVEGLRGDCNVMMTKNEAKDLHLGQKVWGEIHREKVSDD